jgi:hypothetical protein
VETRQKVDWELAVLAIFVFAIGIVSLWHALLPQLPPLAKNLLSALGVLLALIGSIGLYADPRLESWWAFWIVLAKDAAVAMAFLVLGLLLGCSGC